LEFIEETNASNFAIDVVLSQLQPVTNELHPICYYSRGLTKSKKSNSNPLARIGVITWKEPNIHLKYTDQ